ncbi:hypothetical protein [Portibacter marinus]|uniref:hypothetical protein n=1 Tax=Portibacter marinus TaxID=2898660 RepID=UPI001F3E99E2|nr:hypothetical protein [Portibacter marinus]
MKSLHIVLLLAITLLGSCFRIPAKIEPGKSISVQRYATMPKAASECSGIVQMNDEWIILNDGSFGPRLLRLSKDGQDSLGIIEIPEVTNKDWEAIAIYEDEIIIGDVGNNLGNRKDLRIYHIDQKTRKLKHTVPIDYPDQVTFDVKKHDFDCEAMIILDGQYYLFSKNRSKNKTKVYSAPLLTNNLVLIDSISLEGMVTDAAYHAESKTFVLTCYEVGLGGFKNSLALVERNAEGKFRTTNIFNLKPAEQIEAIVQIEGNQFLVGSESGFLGNGRHLYLVTIEGL